MVQRRQQLLVERHMGELRVLWAGGCSAEWCACAEFSPPSPLDQLLPFEFFPTV
jgi:hypothetical protein